MLMKKSIYMFGLTFSAIILLCAVIETLLQGLLPKCLGIALGFPALPAIARLPFILAVSFGFAYVLQCEDSVVRFFKTAGYIVVYPTMAYFVVLLILNNGLVSYETLVFYLVLILACQFFLHLSFFIKKKVFVRWLLLILVGLLFLTISLNVAYFDFLVLPPSINIPSGEALL